MRLPSNLEVPAQEVATALRDLERRLEDLTLAIAHGDLPLAVHGAHAERDARRRVVDAYGTIDYRMEDDVQSTPVCLGVVAAAKELLARAARVNESKVKLKAVCSELHGRSVRLPTRGEGGGTEVVPATRAILRSLQRSDLNLIAAYRKVPVLEHRPTVIAWTHAWTRRVQRRSRDQVLALLEHSAKPGAAEDRARLRACRDRWFAIVEPHYENYRANVWYEGLDARGRGRVQVAAELPLMYALGRAKELPELRWPAEGEVATARERAGRLQPAPFLTTLPVHRYERSE